MGHHSDNPTPPAVEGDRLFRLVAESLPSGVVVVDAAGVIVLVNQQIERLFAYTAGELIGQSVDILLPASTRLAHAAHRQEFMAAPEARAMGTRSHLFGRRRNGSEFPVEVALNPQVIEDRTLVVAVVVDASAGRHVERTDSLAVEKQLEFERLIADLSTKFINLPADRVDEVILDALRQIGETLDLDRCTFFRIQPDGLAHAAVRWHRPEFAPAPAPISIKEQFPWVFEMVQAGKLLCFSTVDEIPNPADRAGYCSLGVRSSVTVPLSVSGRVVGAVGFNMLREERSWQPDVVHRLRVFATAFGSVLSRRESDEKLHRTLEEVERLRGQLQAENVYLRTEARERLGTGNIVGRSLAVRDLLNRVRQVAVTDSTVVLLGETGTGKELVATQIHELSARHGRAMVRVNCAAIPSALLESELFGREKGAFTGAIARQIGRFELADQSSIFLDEIGDLPTDVQVKLLRVLEERQIERLGSPKPIRIDTRIIAATHRNLEQLVAEGKFREDLFYRLNVFPIQVPPLRDRVEDIPLLVWGFVEEFSKAFGKRIETISQENMAALQRYAWPGNIRELRNVVERAMIVATSPRLTIPVPSRASSGGKRSDRLVDVEKEHMRRVLESTGWRIRGAGGAADRLGLRPTTLETRLAKLGLKRPKPS